MVPAKNTEPVQLDLNNPVFQDDLFALPGDEQKRVLKQLRRMNRDSASFVDDAAEV